MSTEFERLEFSATADLHASINEAASFLKLYNLYVTGNRIDREIVLGNDTTNPNLRSYMQYRIANGDPELEIIT